MAAGRPCHNRILTSQGPTTTTIAQLFPKEKNQPHPHPQDHERCSGTSAGPAHCRRLLLELLAFREGEGEVIAPALAEGLGAEE